MWVPEMSAENWNKVMATNLTSAFWAAKAQIPVLQAQGGGSVVFTSSFVEFCNGGLPGMAAYAAFKAGLNGLVQSLASEHAADAIRITPYCPEAPLPLRVAKAIRKPWTSYQASSHEANGFGHGDCPGRTFPPVGSVPVHDQQSHDRRRRHVSTPSIGSLIGAALQQGAAAPDILKPRIGGKILCGLLCRHDRSWRI